MVVSPAYDALDAGGRRQLMAENPMTFLHVTRSPEDADDLPLDALTEANAAALQRLLSADLYERRSQPALYLYRLTAAGHTQVAVVADLSLAVVADGQLLPHERTRVSRAEVLARHLARVKVSSSPIAATYRAVPEVDEVVAGVVAEQAPLLSFGRGSPLEQDVWAVDDPETIQALDGLLAGQQLYITDGHHRTAAALRLREWRAERGEGGDPDDPANFVLCALFPHDQLIVREFHRRVALAPGDDVGGALDRIGAVVDLEAVSGPEQASPAGAGQFALYADGAWYRFALARSGPDLDVTSLLVQVLKPALDIDDPATTDRIEYVPGTGGLEELARRCDEKGGLGFGLYPISVEALMEVVDRGDVLPPKSTFFHPKARSGIFLRFREHQPHPARPDGG